jgi:hypothetical protein
MAKLTEKREQPTPLFAEDVTPENTVKVERCV